MMGEITFDTEVPEEGLDHLEGCYRTKPGEWNVYYLTHWVRGELWKGDLTIFKDAVWQSGITGVEMHCPKSYVLNKVSAMKLFSDAFDGISFVEVTGPDSLSLK